MVILMQIIKLYFFDNYFMRQITRAAYFCLVLPNCYDRPIAINIDIIILPIFYSMVNDNPDDFQ